MCNIKTKINNLLKLQSKKVMNAPFRDEEFRNIVLDGAEYKLIGVEIIQGSEDKAYIDYTERMQELKDIFFELSAYIEILDDIYAGKAKSIHEMSHLITYMHKSMVHYVIIKLKEVLVGKSKICLCQMQKFLRANKKQLFDDFKILAKYQIGNNGKIYDVITPTFDIVPLLDIVRDYIDNDDVKKELLKKARNKVCSHLPTNESYEEVKNLCYQNIYDIHDELYYVFNAIYLAQNWHTTFRPKRISHGIQLRYVNEMAKYGQETKRKETDQLRNKK